MIYDIYGNNLTDKEKRRYRILQFNLGNFSNGTFTGYQGDDLEGYVSEWARFIGSCKADLCFWSESRAYVDSNNTTDSNDALYSKLADGLKYPYDNVCVRGNKLKLQSFDVLYGCERSDHYPTVADIIVG